MAYPDVPMNHSAWTDEDRLDAERAIEVLEERGWCTGHWAQPDGKVCVEGAWGLAAAERLGLGIPTNTARDRSMNLALDVFLAGMVDELSAPDPFTGLDCHLGTRSKAAIGSSLNVWNDWPGRTPEDVKMLLKDVAFGTD